MRGSRKQELEDSDISETIYSLVDLPLEIKIEILRKDVSNYNSLIDYDPEIRNFFNDDVRFERLASETKKRITETGYYYPNKDKSIWIDRVGSGDIYHTYIFPKLKYIDDCYEISRTFDVIINRDDKNSHIYYVKNGIETVTFKTPCYNQYDDNDPLINIIIEINYYKDKRQGPFKIYRENEVISHGIYQDNAVVSYRTKERNSYFNIVKIFDGEISIPFDEYDMVEIYDNGDWIETRYDYIENDNY